MELYAFPFIALFFVGIFTREIIAPASRNSCDHRWLILSTSLAAATVVVTIGIGYFFADLIRIYSLVSAGIYMPDLLVGMRCFLLASFIFYWWHRALHKSDLLWRVFHQLHHSPQRVEALTAFFAHPLDTAAAVLISVFSSYLILGASPLAAAFALLLTGIFDIFLHSDIKTPTWLGYLIQRPEMHSVHHERGHHAQNYGLPVWDLLFNTWTNPQLRREHLGFDADEFSSITDLLLFRDVLKSMGAISSSKDVS
jgi:sterol desaturase/sphingolipid hydroxylase (fatty acid hydroxylase superfamily)